MKLNREGNLVGKTTRECTKCKSIFTITSKTVVICPACNTARVKAVSPESRMLARARTRAYDKKEAFFLTVEDINIPETCPILGIPLKTNSGRSGAFNDSPSLDRKDNSKGYKPDNVHVISTLANRMKGHASIEELQLMAKWINENFPIEN